MNKIEISYVTDAMKTYGGSFVKALGEAWARADEENRARLFSVFPDIYNRYEEMALEDRRRAKEIQEG